MQNDSITFGKHSYGDIRMVGGTLGHITIGKYTCLGEDVQAFMSFDHNLKNISTFPFGHPAMPITKLMKEPLPDKNTITPMQNLNIHIGNDCWIGSHTIIFRGVTIGDGTIIGAYSKITKSVPPYVVVVGDNHIIRNRFSPEDTEFLLKLKWWNWEDQKVADAANILCSPDLNELKRIYG
jgi:acetyltransferase-like isoleucine patch superfamily enzyme